MKSKNNQRLTWGGGYFSPLNKKTMYLGVLAFLSLLLLTAYVSYAVFSVKEEKSGTLNIVTGTLYSHIESSELDSNNQISVKAGETKSFDVTLKNINNRPVKTNFYYQWISSNPGNVEVGYSTVSKDVPPTVEGYVLGVNASKVITVVIKNESGRAVILQFGSDAGLEKANLEFPNNSYALTKLIQLEYRDNSGAAVPDLADGLIPVIYNGTNWVSADISEKWYAYDEQWWANAVTTTSTNRVKYQTPGTVIPMSDINTMWVWVPRYEYKFSNMADQYAGGTVELPGGIAINFLSKNITTPSDVSNYVIHPAFNFGGVRLSGIWVGKFEPGNQTYCATSSYVAGTNCDVTTLGVQIKPNVNSWRGIRVSTAFTVSREMSNSGNAYGLNNATTDSHMMKNTEWGAVAYLSQSIYGKYGNSAYAGANKEVYVNNYSGYQTGCSAGAPLVGSANSCAYTYEKENTGTGASTTGNIYGVYDMSGGAYEHVMGNMKASGNSQQQSGDSIASNQNSGFNGPNYTGDATTGGRAYPAAKYYDTYRYSTSYNDHSSRYIKGDATYEVSQGDGKNFGWYYGEALFVNTNGPWFRRGGSYANASGAGVFAFQMAGGFAYDYYSFRIVLVPIA